MPWIKHLSLKISVGIVVLAVITTSVFVQYAHSQTDLNWPSVQRWVRERFPDVTHVSTDELHQWLSSATMVKPLLLDARTLEEYDVSHLPGAMPATTQAQALANLKRVEKNRLIVVYCSVGYRSSLLARQLKQQGFTNVYNLEGSIFAWANEGKPLTNGHQTVPYAHPYNAEWGSLLRRDLWFPKELH